MNKMNGVMNNSVVAFNNENARENGGKWIKFEKGEKVKVTLGKLGNYNIYSEDGSKEGWAADFEVTLTVA